MTIENADVQGDKTDENTTETTTEPTANKTPDTEAKVPYNKKVKMAMERAEEAEAKLQAEQQAKQDLETRLAQLELDRDRALYGKIVDDEEVKSFKEKHNIDSWEVAARALGKTIEKPTTANTVGNYRNNNVNPTDPIDGVVTRYTENQLTDLRKTDRVKYDQILSLSRQGKAEIVWGS